MDMIIVKNLCKSYGSTRAVDNLDFSVAKAECCGILGPNGAGKTTTVKMLFGRTTRDNTPDTILEIAGFDPLHQELDIRCRSGVVQQEDNLDEDLNVVENLTITAGYYAMPKRVHKERINYLLEFMELGEKRNVPIKTLSGGMKRRLCIARSLINDPEILFLDEPTTGLDPQVRHLIWNKIRELKKKGVTILLTTHYMDEAFQLCDNIIIMDHGKKILEGNPHHLLDENIEKYVLECTLMPGHSCDAMNTSSFRCEQHHDLTRFYSNDFEKLKQFIEQSTFDRYYIRQSNLEDIFLKFTGRVINEQQ